MTNSGVKKSLEKLGITTLETKVGDRFVYECMQKGDFSLGGEQSGHIILKKYATTGDGILTAIMLAEEICDTKRSLSDLAEDVFLYPQHLENIRVSDKAAVMSSESVKKALSEIEEKIGGKGRILLRESGTEPKIRVMVECESEEKCKEYALHIADVIKNGGWCIE